MLAAQVLLALDSARDRIRSSPTWPDPGRDTGCSSNPGMLGPGPMKYWTWVISTGSKCPFASCLIGIGCLSDVI
jgi:hypothetical protein